MRMPKIAVLALGVALTFGAGRSAAQFAKPAFTPKPAQVAKPALVPKPAVITKAPFVPTRAKPVATPKPSVPFAKPARTGKPGTTGN